MPEVVGRYAAEADFVEAPDEAVGLAPEDDEVDTAGFDSEEDEDESVDVDESEGEAADEDESEDAEDLTAERESVR